MTDAGSRWRLWSGVAISVAAYVGLAVIDLRHDTLRADQTAASVACYITAFAGFGLVAWSNERRSLGWGWLWILPIVFRLLLLTGEPTLSDDVHRYLWDGHLVAEGVNPYEFEINAAELDPFEIPARRLANNPTLSSPYLPAAHGVFGAAAVVAPSQPLTMQVVMTLFDLGSALLLIPLLRCAGLPSRRLALYLWNPLIIVETAHGAHLDALMIFLALLAVTLALRPAGSNPASPVALALASLTRAIPVLLAPVLWWRWSAGQRVLFVATAAALIIPFGLGPSGFGLRGPPTGTGVFGSARVYSQQFRFNAVPARTIEDLFGTDGAEVFIGALMGLTVLVTLVLARRTGPQPGHAAAARRLLRLASVPVAAYVLLTPVLHPWYLTLLLVLLIFVTPVASEGADRWLLLAPWSVLAATLPLSYLTYRNPEAFGELDWVRAVEWYPTIALLVFTTFWVVFAVQAEPPSGGQLSPSSTDPSPRDEPTNAVSVSGSS